MNLILLGAPGAGKGTQAEVISKKHQLFHVSTGNLFRKALSEGNDIGQKAKSYMEKGELVPDEIVLQIVVENLPENSGYLFDGFPRNDSQAKALDEMLGRKGKKIDVVINIEVDPEFLLKRMMSRGRFDDNIETIKNRFNVYKTETSPLKLYYFDQKKLVNVDGNASIEEVTQSIEDVLETHSD